MGQIPRPGWGGAHAKQENGHLAQMALRADFPAVCSSGLGGGGRGALAESLGSNPGLDISPPFESRLEYCMQIVCLLAILIMVL